METEDLSLSLSLTSEGHSSLFLQPGLSGRAFSLLRAPKETHVAHLLFWYNNAGPFRSGKPDSWLALTELPAPRGLYTARELVFSLKGESDSTGMKSPTACQP